MKIFIMIVAMLCVLTSGFSFFGPSPVIRTSSLLNRSATLKSSIMMSATLSKFSLPLADDTRITINNFDRSHCIILANEVNNILAAFKRIKANAVSGGAPYKENSVEFVIDAGNETSIYVECNPNLYPDPFKAMVFVKVSDKSVVVSSQAQLTKLADVIKSFLAETKG